MGFQKSDLDAYREACELVRADLGTPPVPAPQPQPAQVQGNPPPAQAAPPAQSRFEAKRAAPRSPTAAQGVTSATPPATRALTASEIVAQMKKARGQQF